MSTGPTRAMRQGCGEPSGPNRKSPRNAVITQAIVQATVSIGRDTFHAGQGRAATSREVGLDESDRSRAQQLFQALVNEYVIVHKRTVPTAEAMDASYLFGIELLYRVLQQCFRGFAE